MKGRQEAHSLHLPVLEQTTLFFRCVIAEFNATHKNCVKLNTIAPKDKFDSLNPAWLQLVPKCN